VLDWLDSHSNNAARILVALNLVAVAATLSGQGVIQALDLQPAAWVWALAILVLATIQFLLWRSVGSRRVHSLRERSEGFTRFFSDWYSQDGRHTIYCSDLEWLEHPEHSAILLTLMRRSTHVEVFVRSDSSPVCNQLRQSGVAVYTIPPTTYTHVRMSLHQSEEQETVIIRRKISRPNPEESIVFVESDDRYLVALAKDLLASCRSSHLD